MPEKPFRYPFGIIGNLCNFTYVFINLTPKAAGGMLEHQRSFGKYSGNNFSMVYAVNVLQMIPFSTTQRVCLIEDEEKLGRGADLM